MRLEFNELRRSYRHSQADLCCWCPRLITNRTTDRAGPARAPGPARALGDAQNKTPALPGFSGGAQNKTPALPGLLSGALNKTPALPGFSGGAQNMTPAPPVFRAVPKVDRPERASSPTLLSDNFKIKVILPCTIRS